MYTTGARGMTDSKNRVAKKRPPATMRSMQDSLPDNFVDSRDFARIATAIRFIDEHFREQPSLEDVAAQAGPASRRSSTLRP